MPTETTEEAGRRNLQSFADVINLEIKKAIIAGLTCEDIVMQLMTQAALEMEHGVFEGDTIEPDEIIKMSESLFGGRMLYQSTPRPCLEVVK